jgi:hypothetical protein
MPAIKRNTTKKGASLKTVIVTKSKIASGSASFSKKLDKVNTMLGKTKWMSP